MKKLELNPAVRNLGAVRGAIKLGRAIKSSHLPSFHGMSQSKSFRKSGEFGVSKSANKGDKFY